MNSPTYLLKWRSGLLTTVIFCDNWFHMTEWHEIAKSLDSCYTLFLQEIGEPRENELRLLLLEGMRSDEAESRQLAGVTFEGLHRIRPTDGGRVFELIWNQYIAYAVANESFAVANGRENADSGHLLRCYSQSAFLDYVAHATVATAEFPGPYTHARILSESHIIDVVSTAAPTFEVCIAGS
jgi:hypothetical protein